MKRMDNLTIADKSALPEEIEGYWDGRSATYSNSVKDEMRDFHLEAWEDVLSKMVGDGAPAGLRVLDLGCGPGFFEVVLSRLGCLVDAVDGSAQMLDQARANVAENGVPGLVDFHRCDVSDLPFLSSSYDVVVSRNVTWLMRDPLGAYAEWGRVLKPSGKLLVFDANWYSYLVDESLNRKRIEDQGDSSVLGWGDQSFATDERERRCESIALRLPLTYENRPAWDVSVLPSLGFSDVRADEGFWRRVWSEGERAFYATSPLFSTEALKAEPAVA